MGQDIAVIWGSGKQKYFRFVLIFRLTRIPIIGSDLPVGLLCRTRALHRKRDRGPTTDHHNPRLYRPSPWSHAATPVAQPAILN
jgi:hypothetical protein